MAPRFLIHLLLVLPLLANSQNYNIGDTLFVWNIDGSPIYSEPTSNASLIDTLEHGTKAVVLSQELRSVPFEFTVTNGFTLKGYWVKINTNTVVGYIFDADCSTIDSNVKNERERWNSLYRRFLGKQTNFEKIERTAKYGNSEYQITDEVSTYENGTYTYTPFDGCFNHTYKFNNTSFNEIYHLMMNVHVVSMGPFEERPTYQSTEEQTFKFSGTEATGEIQIRIKNDKSIELFSYDCT